MPTDLFSEYYNNPKKSAIYTNLTCNSANSADELSFEITESNGVITSNNETLSSIDLSDVLVGLTQYSTEMKIINPYSFIYVRGTTDGESYMSKSFEILNDNIKSLIINDENWEYNTSITFIIKYYDEYGKSLLKLIKADGDDDTSFIDICQNILDENNIPVTISINNDNSKYYIQFTSTTLGYSFNINHIVLWYTDNINYDRNEIINDILKQSVNKSEFAYGFNQEWIDKYVPIEYRDNIDYCINVYTSLIGTSDYQKIYALLEIINGYIEVNISNYPELYTDYLLEDISKYIPAYKYKNGAFKGCVIKAIYPQYNADNITESMRSLKIAHIQDRIEDYHTTIYNQYTGIPICVKTIKDVNDGYTSEQDLINYNKWKTTNLNTADKWINFDEIPHFEDASTNKWSNSSIPDNITMTSVYKDVMTYDTIGLYGYCTYLTKYNLWSNFGQLYIRTTVEDDESLNTKNLLTSFIIYNPNNFPVEVNYMTFV